MKVDKLGLEISGIVFVGIFIFSAFTIIDASNWKEARFLVSVDWEREFHKEVIDVQSHTPTKNCTMIYNFFSSSEIYLSDIRCIKLPSYQEWKFLMRYNELVGGELTKDFSDYVENQLIKSKEQNHGDV